MTSRSSGWLTVTAGGGGGGGAVARWQPAATITATTSSSAAEPRLFEIGFIRGVGLALRRPSRLSAVHLRLLPGSPARVSAEPARQLRDRDPLPGVFRNALQCAHCRARASHLSKVWPPSSVEDRRSRPTFHIVR